MQVRSLPQNCAQLAPYAVKPIYLALHDQYSKSNQMNFIRKIN